MILYELYSSFYSLINQLDKRVHPMKNNLIVYLTLIVLISSSVNALTISDGNQFYNVETDTTFDPNLSDKALSIRKEDSSTLLYSAKDGDDTMKIYGTKQGLISSYTDPDGQLRQLNILGQYDLDSELEAANHQFDSTKGNEVNEGGVRFLQQDGSNSPCDTLSALTAGDGVVNYIDVTGDGVEEAVAVGGDNVENPTSGGPYEINIFSISPTCTVTNVDVEVYTGFDDEQRTFTGDINQSASGEEIIAPLKNRDTEYSVIDPETNQTLRNYTDITPITNVGDFDNNGHEEILLSDGRAINTSGNGDIYNFNHNFTKTLQTKGFYDNTPPDIDSVKFDQIDSVAAVNRDDDPFNEGDVIDAWSEINDAEFEPKNASIKITRVRKNDAEVVIEEEQVQNPQEGEEWGHDGVADFTANGSQKYIFNVTSYDLENERSKETFTATSVNIPPSIAQVRTSPEEFSKSDKVNLTAVKVIDAGGVGDLEYVKASVREDNILIVDNVTLEQSTGDNYTKSNLFTADKPNATYEITVWARDTDNSGSSSLTKEKIIKKTESDVGTGNRYDDNKFLFFGDDFDFGLGYSSFEDQLQILNREKNTLIATNQNGLLKISDDIKVGNFTLYDSSKDEIPRERFDLSREVTRLEEPGNIQYTTQGEETLFVDTNSTNATIVISDSDISTGRELKISDSGRNSCQKPIDISAENNETINGKNSIQIKSNGGSLTLEYNGFEWIVTNKFAPSNCN